MGIWSWGCRGHIPGPLRPSPPAAAWFFPTLPWGLGVRAWIIHAHTPSHKSLSAAVTPEPCPTRYRYIEPHGSTVLSQSYTRAGPHPPYEGHTYHHRVLTPTGSCTKALTVSVAGLWELSPSPGVAGNCSPTWCLGWVGTLPVPHPR